MKRYLVALGICFVARSAYAADVPVSTAAQLTTAIGAAKAGDTIVLAAGMYKISAKLSCSAVGTAAAPITVKSATPLTAKIEFDTVEGFAVTGAYWTFEGLDIKGVCAVDSNCEHAFHVSGDATNFTLRGNKIYDFNAQLKVNAGQIGGVWKMPHKGLLEGNEVFDTRPRNTSNPTTKFNIDTGDDWIVRANIIRDFQKGGGDNVSYGTFMKSGGKNGLYERNLVLCSRDTTGGTRIGLSFGGGGTAPQFCFPAFSVGTPCSVEHDGGTMRNNIIANCSDVGIYLNRAKNTKILHNTIIGTNGVDFRFDTTSGEAHGNVLTSKIRIRDGGTFTGTDNLMDVATTTFAAMYLDPLKGDLRKKGDLASVIDKAVASVVTDDYCGRTRTGTHDWGAMEHSLGDCTSTMPDSGVMDGEVEDTGIGATDDDILRDSAPRPDATDDGGINADAPTTDEGGCACRTAPATRADGAGAALVLAAALVSRRRRRR
jgi:MYXO-CTERM domain-containing protein